MVIAEILEILDNSGVALTCMWLSRSIIGGYFFQSTFSTKTGQSIDTITNIEGIVPRKFRVGVEIYLIR